MKSFKSVYYTLTTSTKKTRYNNNSSNNTSNTIEDDGDYHDNYDNDDDDDDDDDDVTRQTKVNHGGSSRLGYLTVKTPTRRMRKGSLPPHPMITNIEELVYLEEERRRLEDQRQEEEENRLVTLPWIVQCYIIELYMQAPTNIQTDRNGNVRHDRLFAQQLPCVSWKWFRQCSKIFQRDAKLVFRPSFKLSDYRMHFSSIYCLANHINRLEIIPTPIFPHDPRLSVSLFGRSARTDYLSPPGRNDSEFFSNITSLVIDDGQRLKVDFMHATIKNLVKVLTDPTSNSQLRSVTLSDCIYLTPITPLLTKVQSLTLTVDTSLDQDVILRALDQTTSLFHLTITINESLNSDFYNSLPTTLESLTLIQAKKPVSEFVDSDRYILSLNSCNFKHFDRYPNLSRLAFTFVDNQYYTHIIDQPSLIHYLQNDNNNSITDLSGCPLEFTPEIHKLLQTKTNIRHWNLFISTNEDNLYYTTNNNINNNNNSNTNNYNNQNNKDNMNNNSDQSDETATSADLSCLEPIYIHKKVKSLTISSYAISQESKLIVSNILDSLHNHRDLVSLKLELGQINESIILSLSRLFERNHSIGSLTITTKGSTNDIPLVGFDGSLSLQNQALLTMHRALVSSPTIISMTLSSSIFPSHLRDTRYPLSQHFEFIHSYFHLIFSRKYN